MIPQKTESFKSKEEILELLVEVFKNHIGIENAISSEQLFFKITNIYPDDMDYYEKSYRWNAIRRLLGVLRREGLLFVVMGHHHHYVLDSNRELASYKNKVDATIKGLRNIKDKADIWVESKKLKQLKAGNTKGILRLS